MGKDIVFQTKGEHAVIGFSSARVDTDNGVIRGVTLITGGITAEGHDLYVDDTTVKQLHELAVKRGKIPVTLEHTGGIKDVNGYVENFSIQGNKLKGDWVLLQNHDETPVMLERAMKQPETFGLSVAFKGKGVKCGGKNCARAEKLLSADCVKRQAANPDGLFSAKDDVTVELTVDTAAKNMADNIQHQNGNEPTLTDVLQAIQGLGQRIDSIEQVQSQLVDHVNSSVEEEAGLDPNVLSALYNMTEQELAQFNEENGTQITRDEINSAVADYNASLGEEGDPGEGGELGGESDAGLAAASASGSTALSALAHEILELKAKDRNRERAARANAEKIEFAELQNNIATIIEQRDRLVELSERVIAENEILRSEAASRGARPAGASLGKPIEFSERKAGGDVIEFEEIVNNEYRRLLKEGVADKTARSKAVDFGVKRYPGSYSLWRKNGGTIEFSAE